MTTTATTVAGRPLSGWSRDARFGTWHALLPGRPGEPVLGALHIDRALLAPEGTRERLAGAVLAAAKLRLPGLLGTVDLVAQAGEAWLITARPPVPTVAGLLAAEDSRPDAGSAASVLNETAQTLLALHAAGLAHGSPGPDTVTLAPDGVALLAEAALGSVLGDSADTDLQAHDVRAWAGLARALGAAWAGSRTPAAELFAHCAATAESDGLAAARAALVSGRGALPADFLHRTALRAAVAAVMPEVTGTSESRELTEASPSPQFTEASPSPQFTEALQGPEFTGASPSPQFTEASPSPQFTEALQGPEFTGASPSPQFTEASPSPQFTGALQGPEFTGASPSPQFTGTLQSPEFTASREAAADRTPPADEQPTVPPRADTLRPPALSDTQATVLGKRNRVASAPVPAGEEAGEIVLRFGPGVPVDEQDALRARWRTAPPAPAAHRPRRRRRAWIAATAVLAFAAVLLWLLLRPTPAPGVLAVQVQAPARQLHCGQTADLVGVVTTDGRGGPVTYHWLRSDGHDSGELVSTARSGERRLRVHLRWTVRGPGRFQGTARLRIPHRDTPMEAKATFSYACS
ncbi:hypothetical protein [Streptomyces cellostaticus]|uniref:hypothetical protein n=3 Tax=Streptomyces cellostaticus TaxID=67285 RepID=UPI00295F2EE4|nr:hypothetical protein [Streptomyces cellostaticus]